MSSNINNNATAGQCSTNSRSDLSFGTEVEFIGIFPQQLYVDPEDVVEDVRNGLATATVKLACKKPGCRYGEHEWALPVHQNEADVNFNLWTLTTDMSIVMPRDYLESLELSETHLVAGLELVSRVQSFEGTTPCPLGQTYPCTGEVLQWAWRDELECFLNAVQAIFRERGFRVLVNDTTGVHVHIGKGDKGLALPVVQGLVGTMTALERCFDSVLPTHRINGDSTDAVDAGSNQSSPLPGLAIDGFHAMYKPGILNASQDFKTGYYSAMTKVMFNHVRDSIENIIAEADASGTVSDAATKSVRELFSSFNVPAWLEMIKSKTSVEEIKLMGLANKNNALNLRGLGDVPHRDAPPTAEIRVPPGSLDSDEISAWVDLLCSLTLWLETMPRDEVFSFLLNAWESSEFTIWDLAVTVQACKATGDYFHAVLGDTYAQKRYEASSAADSKTKDRLSGLTHLIEWERRNASLRENIDEKVRWKLESGRYGQMPNHFLEAQPECKNLSRPEAKFLRLDGDQQAWYEVLEKHYRDQRGVSLSAGDQSCSTAGASESGVSAATNTGDGKLSKSADDESDDEDGSNEHIYYGLHPGLATAYAQVPGQHLEHLRKHVVSMPEVPLSPGLDLAALDEEKNVELARLRSFLQSMTAEKIARASTPLEAEDIADDFGQARDQVRSLSLCLKESRRDSSASRRRASSASGK
jgi:hypothetical protein